MFGQYFTTFSGASTNPKIGQCHFGQFTSTSWKSLRLWWFVETKFRRGPFNPFLYVVGSPQCRIWIEKMWQIYFLWNGKKGKYFHWPCGNSTRCGVRPSAGGLSSPFADSFSLSDLNPNASILFITFDSLLLFSLDSLSRILHFHWNLLHSFFTFIRQFYFFYFSFQNWRKSLVFFGIDKKQLMKKARQFQRNGNRNVLYRHYSTWNFL